MLNKMINFRKAKFVKSACGKDDVLYDYDHVLFVGKSNVGKSSLLNALCDNKGLAYVSKTPGHTKLLNHFLIDERFYLVDAPGYGYRKLGKKDQFDEMMSQYFERNHRLKLVVWLLDSRHEPSDDDCNFFEYLSELKIPALIVLTKCDKLNQSERFKIKRTIENLFETSDYIMVSSLKKQGIEELQKRIGDTML